MNAPCSMYVRASQPNRSILVKERQYEKAAPSIVAREFGRTTFVSDVQKENTLIPKVVRSIQEERSIEVSEAQPMNAPVSMVVRETGRSIDVSEEPENAEIPILITSYVL